jgi:ABC-type branched-subunit amino acid transport system substrate-binding protein
VEIGVMAPLTGGAATGGQLALAAELDYIEYFNEELAIPGVTLKIVWEDTALDPVIEESVLGCVEFSEQIIKEVKDGYGTRSH